MVGFAAWCTGRWREDGDFVFDFVVIRVWRGLVLAELGRENGGMWTWRVESGVGAGPVGLDALVCCRLRVGHCVEDAISLFIKFLLRLDRGHVDRNVVFVFKTIGQDSTGKLSVRVIYWVTISV